MLDDMTAVLCQLLLTPGQQFTCPSWNVAFIADGVYHEVMARDLIESRHVEWCGGRTLLDVAAHNRSVSGRPCRTWNCARESVKCEDHID